MYAILPFDLKCDGEFNHQNPLNVFNTPDRMRAFPSLFSELPNNLLKTYRNEVFNGIPIKSVIKTLDVVGYIMSQFNVVLVLNFEYVDKPDKDYVCELLEYGTPVYDTVMGIVRIEYDDYHVQFVKSVCITDIKPDFKELPETSCNFAKIWHNALLKG